MTIRRRVRVTGRVQGVGFRDFVQRHARDLGVAGFVSNADDGSVVAELEGEDEAAAALLASIRQEAPRFARIDAVEVKDIETTGETGFRVTG